MEVEPIIKEMVESEKQAVENKTLWVFGDSFSADFSHIKNRIWSQEYIKFLGYHPSCYGELLARDLGMYFRNLAEPGISNYSIIDLISLNIDNIKKNDIVVIGWTSPTRWRYVNNGTWKDVSQSLENDEYDIFDKEIIEKISANRLDKLYESELFNWVELIHRLLGGIENRFIYHWTWYPLEQYPLINRIRGERIKDETNGHLVDNHFSANSHRILSKKIQKEYNTWNVINEK